jgi:predicted nicotinamide N-methyase
MAGSSPEERALRERFAVRAEPFTHGPISLEMLLPESAEALIDEAEFDADERLPYWADLWPSARALTRHLLDHPPSSSGRAVELGCGVALPSLALRSLGREVLATDYYADALRFARANAERNHLAPLETRLLDWRDPPAELGRFDLVLAADVLYEQRNAEALSAALPALVAPGAVVLLADPGRVWLPEFRTRMAAAGWAVEELATRAEPSPGPTGRQRSQVQILELRPPSA